VSAALTSARERSFVRKVLYLVAIGGLLMPLFWLSQPATRDTKAARGQPGGKLAQLRQQFRLSQTELGQVDPTSETIRLATLGMRGVAGDILWWKANKYQMKKDWTNLRAALEQISRLQPHSIAVWRYQAWNLSYNVCASFDDYHDKYYWVIEGIKFLQRGAELNAHESRILWDVGWFIAHKIGRADEAKPFRRLFKEDDQFQGATPPELRDNWLVAKNWFRKAEELIDARHPVKGMAEQIFYSDRPMCQFNYAEFVEKDGRFGEKARQAWKGAANEWHEFGERVLSVGDGLQLCLNEQETHEEAARQAAAALDKLAPGLQKKIVEEKRARLTPRERKAWDTPPANRSNEQTRLAMDLQGRMIVSHEEIARRVTGPNRSEAMKLAQEASHQEDLAQYVHRERTLVNFEYWRLRAEMEQTPQAVAAREAVFKGDQAYGKGDIVAAREAYERGLLDWRILLDRFPLIKDDINLGDDLVGMTGRYVHCLEKLDEKLPRPFILQDILDKHGHRR
jgi:hypothetical protein